jgi:hypothetical protein
MLVLLKIKDDIITDVRWKTFGCAIASTSMLPEVIKRMNTIVPYWGIRRCEPPLTITLIRPEVRDCLRNPELLSANASS